MIDQKSQKDIFFWKMVVQNLFIFRLRMYIVVFIGLLLLVFHYLPYTNIILSPEISWEIFVTGFVLLLPTRSSRTLQLVLLLFVLEALLTLTGKTLVVEFLGNIIYLLLIKSVVQFALLSRKNI